MISINYIEMNGAMVYVRLVRLIDLLFIFQVSLAGGEVGSEPGRSVQHAECDHVRAPGRGRPLLIAASGTRCGNGNRRDQGKQVRHCVLSLSLSLSLYHIRLQGQLHPRRPQPLREVLGDAGVLLQPELVLR